MEELGLFVTACFVIGLFVSCGVLLTNTFHRSELRSVGIERIAHCSNAHSNWNEIVWIKK